MPGVSVHGGVDATATQNPGSRGYVKWYDWLFGPGRRKWNSRTELHSHLVKHMSPAMAKRATSAWCHEVTGLWAGFDLNRVRRGEPLRGTVIGRG
jgi:hypothetical protein